ncbi:MAG: hypothetical protein ONB44_20305 [candidate division KSB1 bacterium]|nr:hypothetical protein [candidate division KSB1 bacterium]MDZ7312980.1 hypothetical protein [candidate division KSB1 bacterium]
MPKRHGLSHGLATFVSVITAGLLIAILRSYIPFFIGIFDDVGLWLSNWLVAKFGKQIPPSLLSTAVFASLLAFVWGVAFAVMNRRRL